MADRTESYGNSSINKVENPANNIGSTMPGSVYASTIHPENVQALVADLIRARDAVLKPEFIARELPRDREGVKELIAAQAIDKLYHGSGQDIGKPTAEYVRLAVDSVHDHPERTMKQHASSLRPTAEDQRHWGPLAKIAMPDSEVGKYTWKAETGTIQTYQHVETGKHVHIDGNTDKFYDQKRNPISRHEAFQHAESVSHSHRIDVQQQERYGIGR